MSFNKNFTDNDIYGFDWPNQDALQANHRGDFQLDDVSDVEVSQQISMSADAVSAGFAQQGWDTFDNHDEMVSFYGDDMRATFDDIPKGQQQPMTFSETWTANTVLNLNPSLEDAKSVPAQPPFAPAQGSHNPWSPLSTADASWALPDAMVRAFSGTVRAKALPEGHETVEVGELR